MVLLCFSFFRLQQSTACIMKTASHKQRYIYICMYIHRRALTMALRISPARMKSQLSKLKHEEKESPKKLVLLMLRCTMHHKHFLFPLSYSSLLYSMA